MDSRLDHVLMGCCEDALVSPSVASMALVTAVISLLYYYATKSNIPAVRGISAVPGSLPFIGSLGSLGGRQGKNDGSVYTRWAKVVKSDLFQMRLGDQRTIVVNSFRAIKDLWVGHANDLIDRPFQHGFADKLEYDLSGAAMTEPIRRCRKAAMRALGKPMWPSYYSLLEPSSVELIRSTITAGCNGEEAIDIYPALRQVVFDLALSLTYGTRVTGANNNFVEELIKSINEISHLRSSTQRYRDYTPILRWLIPDALSGNVIVTAEKERQHHLDILYADLQKRMATGEDIKCIVTGLVNDKLSLPESHGVCKALLQAAPDSTASSIYIGIGWLSTPTGLAYQAELHSAIMNVYRGDRDRAWDMAFREETVPLIMSFYKETLRYWTTTPFATPRATANDVEYRGSTIPKGVTMIMNAQQGNHDVDWYGSDALTFNPRRFLDNDTSLPHLTFGAGSRICPAAALSNRIIYAMIVRLTLAFEMRESTEPGARKPNVDMIDFSDVRDSLVALPRRYDCCYIARDSEWLTQKMGIQV